MNNCSVRSLLPTVVTVVAVIVFTVSKASAEDIIVVTPQNMDGWGTLSQNTASGSFVEGPAIPPLGTGSYGMITGGSTGRQFLATAQFNGTRLDQVAELRHSTFVSSFLDGQAVYIELFVDYTNDGAADDALFFEPTYQFGTTPPVPDQGDVFLNTWQTWDARAGGWWSVAGVAGATPSSPGVKTIDQILAVVPDATVVDPPGFPGGPGVILSAGDGVVWANFAGNVDDFQIRVGAGNLTRFDFEVPEPSTVLLIIVGLAGLGVVQLRKKILPLRRGNTSTC